MWVWDYSIKKDWKPRTDKEWEWFLVRKINYGDFKGIKRAVLAKFFPRIKKKLDVGKSRMFENFLRNG